MRRWGNLSPSWGFSGGTDSREKMGGGARGEGRVDRNPNFQKRKYHRCDILILVLFLKWYSWKSSVSYIQGFADYISTHLKTITLFFLYALPYHAILCQQIIFN